MLSSGGIYDFFLFSDFFRKILAGAFVVALVAFYGSLLYYAVSFWREGR